MAENDVSAVPLHREVVIGPEPQPRGEWLGELWRHREVFAMLARKDFQTRYKRASLGILWAVAVPVLQGAIMAYVFSKVVKLGSSAGAGAMILAGVLAFAYFGATLSAAVTAIVDGSSLTDKVWFPRVLLVLVPGFANLISLGVSLVVLLVALPLLGGELGVNLLALIPATLLLVAFTAALSLVVAALHVYYRDTKFLVQAALLLWIYVTPVLYPKELLGRVGPWLDANPMTGIVTLFHIAAVGTGEAWVRPVTVSVVVTVVLLVIGLEAQRHHDRLFVDLL